MISVIKQYKGLVNMNFPIIINLLEIIKYIFEHHSESPGQKTKRLSIYIFVLPLHPPNAPILIYTQAAQMDYVWRIFLSKGTGLIVYKSNCADKRSNKNISAIGFAIRVSWYCNRRCSKRDLNWLQQTYKLQSAKYKPDFTNSIRYE